MPRLTLEEFVPYRLSVLTNTVSGAIAAAYEARFGLSIPEWRVVAVLADSPGLSAAQVAARTAMDKVAVSRAVASLLRARRIGRTRSAADRRRSKLRLSPAGRRLYVAVVPIALAYERELLRPLSRAQRRQLDSLLRDLTTFAMRIGPAHALVYNRAPRTGRRMDGVRSSS